MPLKTARACLAIVLFSGCTVASTESIDLGRADGADDLAAADLAPRSTAGIACGASACFAMAQLCCTNDSGRTGTCDPVQAMTCGDSQFYCDGPEDCPPAEPQCCISNGTAQCQPAGACGVNTVMCHLAGDCGAGSHCCPAPNGSPYSLCLSLPCP